MTIFDEIANKITSVGKDGYNRAKDAKDTTKISMDIKNREIQLQKMFRDLGREYYQDHKQDENLEYPLMTQIKNELDAIASLQVEKDKLRGIRRCPNCGEVTNVNAKFCPACGTQVQKPYAAEVVKEDEIPEPETDKEATVDADFCEVEKEASEMGEAVKEAAKEAVEKAAETVEAAAEAVKEAAENAAENAE